MTTLVRLAIPLCVCILFPLISHAQGDEISFIPFDTVLGNTAVAGGGAPINLLADTQVAGSVVATGEVATGSGIRFSDATLQKTAAMPVPGLSANQGLYSNTIVEMTPPNAYSEVCFKGGGVFIDIHSVPETTNGGNCLPGDSGWIIERDQRFTTTWEEARIQCFLAGMRLPEPFEWIYSCKNDEFFGLNDMEEGWEWISNSAFSAEINAFWGSGAQAAGNPTCDHGVWGWITRQDGTISVYDFRCLR